MCLVCVLSVLSVCVCVLSVCVCVLSVCVCAYCVCVCLVCVCVCEGVRAKYESWKDSWKLRERGVSNMNLRIYMSNFYI